MNRPGGESQQPFPSEFTDDSKDIFELDREIALLTTWNQMVDTIASGYRAGSNPNKWNAANTLMFDVFGSQDPVTTRKILDEWRKFASMDVFTYRSGDDRELAGVLSGLNREALGQVNPTLGAFFRTMNSDPNAYQQPYSLSKMMILLLTTAKIPYSPQYFPAVKHRLGLKSYILLDRRAKYLMARQVRTDIQTGAFSYQNMDSRILTAFDFFLDDIWGKDLIATLEQQTGHPLSYSSHLNDIMHQLSFGAPSSEIWWVARATHLAKNGSFTYLWQIEEFAEAAIIFDPPRIGRNAAGRRRQLQTRIFASRWMSLTLAEKMRLLPLFGNPHGLSKVAESMGISSGITAEFLNNLDLYAIQGWTIPTIFSDAADPRRYKAFSGFDDIESAYLKFRFSLDELNQSSQLTKVLPPRSALVVKFMQLFCDAFVAGKQDLEDVVRNISSNEEFSFDSSYIYGFITRASIFCDFVERLKAFPHKRRSNNLIIDSWVLAGLADYMHEKKEN